MFVYTMKCKSHTFQCFKIFRAMFENHYQCTIKSLVSDNGGEYISSEFTTYLLKSGICHEPGPPHSPQLNGVAERANRTLSDRLRCLMVEATVPKVFWADALRHLTFPINSVPCNTPAGYSSPNAINGVPLINPNCLHPFGCLVWYKVPEANRKKLDPKGRASILLSYLSNGGGYRLWDLERRAVIKSRDVI